MAGLDSILKLRERVASFEREIMPTVKRVIYENESFIIDMNATDQLFDRGVNNLGVSISDYQPYTPYTIEIKKEKGQPYNRVTLHDEGDFAGSIYIEYGEDSFEMKAGDFKTQELIAKYGRQILGLTTDNVKELIRAYIYPELINTRNRLIYDR